MVQTCVLSPARKKDLYRLVDVILAWSLWHGGPVGNFFSGTLYNSIAYGLGTRPPRLKDMPDQDLKQKIIQASLMFDTGGLLLSVMVSLALRLPGLYCLTT